MELISQ